jgi:signal transduction histidine kinase
LVEWEAFARSLLPVAAMNPLALRGHAEDILRATARDMASPQNATQKSEKSKGHDGQGHEGRLNQASHVHAIGRVGSGFKLTDVISEYRALRASVIRLWHESGPIPDARDLADLTRFNESIDQSLTAAVNSYSIHVEQSREMFLAILGHDLRNPLNSITMSAEMVSVLSRGDAELSQAASQISAGASVMAAMIADLLDFTRTRLGPGMPLARTTVDLTRLCQEVVDEARSAHPTRTVRFQPHPGLSGRWDPARLRQVVSNLLGNALQHGAESAPVEVSLRSEGSDALIAVHNWGPPIPAAALPNLFEPLVRSSSPELRGQRRPGSIGLGLYIAREVVAAHDGTIEVQSSEKAGTVFEVRLPRTGDHSTHP